MCQRGVGLEQVDRYEELRNGRAELCGAGRGLRLLLRQGVVAWMHAWERLADRWPREESAASERDTSVQASQASGLPDGVQTEVISVLVAMAARRFTEVEA